MNEMYINEYPDKNLLDGITKYSYEEICDAMDEANALNVQFAALLEQINSYRPTKNIFFATEEELTLEAIIRSFLQDNVILDAVAVKGNLGHGSSDLYPLATAKKQMATMRRQIKKLNGFLLSAVFEGL